MPGTSAILDASLREKIEVLDGSRNSTRRRAAVRIEDAIALLQLPASLKSAAAAGAAPTKAEHDALVSDIHALHARLKEVADALQEKLL